MKVDEINLFAKNEKELETLIQTVKIYSQNIEIEFSIEKCSVLIMKRGKRRMMEGMELPNQEKIRTLGEKETYKYLGILETVTIVEIKEKIENEYLRRKQFETKLYSGNLNQGINTRAVRYSKPFLKWTREELQQMDQWTRKFMLMHKALYLRDDVDRLDMSRKKRGRRLTSIQDSVNASIQRLKDNILQWLETVQTTVSTEKSKENCRQKLNLL